MFNILYIGSDQAGSTSMHRAFALRRLGNRVQVMNPSEPLASQFKLPFFDSIHFHTGFRLAQGLMLKWLKGTLPFKDEFDLIWVDSGEHLGRECLKYLRTFGCPIVLYNIDDPTGERDGRRFDSLLSALSLYDLVVVVRRETEDECRKLGAKRVLRVLRSYDEEAHRPFDTRSDIPSKFRSEVAFIGTWMRHEHRDKFLLHLIENNIPVNIWGNSWQKSKYFSILKDHWRGYALSGREYIAAVQGAKICLGLLSAGNRDLHTTRSLEIPYAGGLFCAKRTSEHLELYDEGTEAVFWDDEFECVEVCRALLANPELEDIRLAGMRRVRSLNAGNENICGLILDTVSEFQLVQNQPGSPLNFINR